MNKKHRVAVWYKYGCRCAYCGKMLFYKEMRVDHLKPRLGGDAPLKEVEIFENYMPSCYRCNHYKGGYSLEEFREQMKILHTRLNKIFKCKVAIDYKIINIEPFDGLFYFEKVKKDELQKTLWKITIQSARPPEASKKRRN